MTACLIQGVRACSKRNMGDSARWQSSASTLSAALLVALAWIASLAGGWLVSPWCLLASLVQVHVLGRRAGRFSTLAALVYPVLVVVFVGVFAWSVVVTLGRRQVTWKGRPVRARPTRSSSG